MKCLSLWQPWASLIAVGAKTIETRSWATSYRGPIAIHAAKKWNRELRMLSLRMPCIAYLATEPTGTHAGEFELPLGCVVALAELWKCEQVSDQTYPGAPERDFGDFRRGRWMWHLRDVRACAVRVEMNGRQGLFDVETDMAALIRSCAVVQVNRGGGVA